MPALPDIPNQLVFIDSQEEDAEDEGDVDTAHNT